MKFDLHLEAGVREQGKLDFRLLRIGLGQVWRGRRARGSDIDLVIDFDLWRELKEHFQHVAWGYQILQTLQAQLGGYPKQHHFVNNIFHDNLFNKINIKSNNHKILNELEIPHKKIRSLLGGVRNHGGIGVLWFVDLGKWVGYQEKVVWEKGIADYVYLQGWVGLSK